MPLHQAITAFIAALLLALVTAIFRPRLEAELGRPSFWLALICCASLASAVSALVAETGHAGTGFVTRHGWPKPWWFDFAGENGERSTSFERLYFVGNMLACASALLPAWSSWRLLPGGRSPGAR
jgi:hypothetical protein